MTRKARNLKKVPKFLQPRHYREYLRMAMEEESRDNANRPRPIDKFSKACTANQHAMCHGTVDVDYTKKGPLPEREECICLCHSDSLF